MPKIAGKLPGNNRTGWQRVAVWDDGQTTGDYTVGQEITASYELVGTNWRADVTYYVVANGRDEAGKWCEIMYGEEDEHDDVEFAVEERTEIWYERDGEQNHYEAMFEGGSVFSYSTVERANTEARSMALVDWAHAFADREFFDNIETTPNEEVRA